jgi:hypothetical protein
MNGMDMMLNSLAKMAGFKPDELKGQIGEFHTFVKTGMEALVAIGEKQDQILSKLEALENGTGK